MNQYQNGYQGGYPINNQMGSVPPKKSIDTLFRAMAGERNLGIYIEFYSWIAMLAAVLFSFLAAILVDGYGGVYTSFRLLWIFMMLFHAGLAVLMALRFKEIAILSGASVIFLVLLLPFYLTEQRMIRTFLAHVPTVTVLVFVFEMMAAIGLIACCAVQFFSKYELRKPIIILAGAAAVGLLLLGTLCYGWTRHENNQFIRDNYNGWIEDNRDYLEDIEDQFADGEIDRDTYRSEKKSFEGIIDEAKENRDSAISDENRSFKKIWARVKNGVGFFGYSLACLAMTCYILAYFLGYIENGDMKISLPGTNANRMPAGYGNPGAYAGMSAGPMGGAGMGGNPGAYAGVNGNPMGGNPGAYAGMNGNPMGGAGMGGNPMANAGMNTNVNPGGMPVLRGLSGSCAGKNFEMQGEILIGSGVGQVHILIQDAYVSSRHCAIRYNAGSGYYEVKDLSTNGVFLANGTKLPSNAYTACPRGTVIYLGHREQQFQLM